MATRPPRNPFSDIPRSHVFDRGYTNSTATMPPAHAASVVLAATRPMPTKSMPDNVEPGLKPYQPNQRMTAPMDAMMRSCGGVGPPPSRLNFRPILGPRTMAPASAMVPPTVCTTVDPAKSRKKMPSPTKPENQPIVLLSQPWGPQTQWAKIG